MASDEQIREIFAESEQAELRLWLAGEFEFVVSDNLLAELTRALAYPTLRARVAASEAAEFVSLLRQGAILAADPPAAPRRAVPPTPATTS